jgi:acetate kinase
MTLALALNSGSSTLKVAVYRFQAEQELELAAETLRADGEGTAALVQRALAIATTSAGGEIRCVGHRVVHGGSLFTAPVLVDDAVVARLGDLVPLAPLHLPPALELLRAARRSLPRAAHVACFDTAFHRTLPEVARRFALPAELYRAGVRRYGFHGLSYEYVVSALGAPPPSRLIIAHLGSGASLAAVRDGRCIYTSMGLTPTGGVPMGSRSGDLDPGVLIHLLRERGLSIDGLEQLLDRESGLAGVGGTSDMSELQRRAEAGDARA